MILTLVSLRTDVIFYILQFNLFLTEASVPVDNMNSALKILQGEMPDLTISYTMMIQGDDYGLTDALGVEVLKNAAK